jgi:hypothetical protein
MVTVAHCFKQSFEFPSELLRCIENVARRAHSATTRTLIETDTGGTTP